MIFAILRAPPPQLNDHAIQFFPVILAVVLVSTCANDFAILRAPPPVLNGHAQQFFPVDLAPREDHFTNCLQTVVDLVTRVSFFRNTVGYQTLRGLIYRHGFYTASAAP